MYEYFMRFGRNRRIGVSMKFVEGGVCAPIGFKATGIHCGIRKNKDKKDLSMILSDCMASSSAV